MPACSTQVAQTCQQCGSSDGARQRKPGQPHTSHCSRHRAQMRKVHAGRHTVTEAQLLLLPGMPSSTQQSMHTHEHAHTAVLTKRNGTHSSCHKTAHTVCSRRRTFCSTNLPLLLLLLLLPPHAGQRARRHTHHTMQENTRQCNQAMQRATMHAGEAACCTMLGRWSKKHPLDTLPPDPVAGALVSRLTERITAQQDTRSTSHSEMVRERHTEKDTHGTARLLASNLLVGRYRCKDPKSGAHTPIALTHECTCEAATQHFMLRSCCTVSGLLSASVSKCP
jgi:hypothetical protein